MCRPRTHLLADDVGDRRQLVEPLVEVSSRIGGPGEPILDKARGGTDDLAMSNRLRPSSTLAATTALRYMCAPVDPSSMKADILSALHLASAQIGQT
jgi:hypothetical protein